LRHVFKTAVRRDIGDSTTRGLQLVQCGAHFGDALGLCWWWWRWWWW
jgi:hypothetical protein